MFYDHSVRIRTYYRDSKLAELKAFCIHAHIFTILMMPFAFFLFAKISAAR